MRISVVIPTVGRPELARAIESVRAQTHPVHEIIVAADTTDEIFLPDDKRIILLRVGPGAGGNAGRQAGVHRATGDVVGLLDDDDEWEPTKVATILRLAQEATGTWIATSQTMMRRADGSTLIQPAFPIRPDEDLRTYMFSKRSPRSGHGFVQASTLVFPRRLALDVPFDENLRFHQDVSWLTEVAKAYRDLNVLQVWEPLCSYHATEGSVSRRITPENSIAWAQRFLDDQPRLRGDFILTQSLGFARRTGSVRSMLRTIGTGLRVGRPGTPAVVYAVGATLKEIARRGRGR